MSRIFETHGLLWQINTDDWGTAHSDAELARQLLQDGIQGLGAETAKTAHAVMLNEDWDGESPAIIAEAERKAFKQATADWASPPQSGHNCYVSAYSRGI